MEKQWKGAVSNKQWNGEFIGLNNSDEDEKREFVKNVQITLHAHGNTSEKRWPHTSAPVQILCINHKLWQSLIVGVEGRTDDCMESQKIKIKLS